MTRARRTKKEIIIAKMEKLDQQINNLQKKMVGLQDEQDKLAKQLANIEAAEKKADEEREQKELLRMIRRSGKSKEEIQDFFKV